jgi:competence protein ComEA
MNPMIKKLLAALAFFYAALSFAAADANTASAADLDGIKGIGPAISSRIVAERKKAPFKDWADFISRVEGVGEKTAARFSAGGLTVNGTGYGKAGKPVAAAAKPAPAPAAPAAAAPAKASVTAPPAAAVPPTAAPAAPAAPAATAPAAPAAVKTPAAPAKP